MTAIREHQQFGHPFGSAHDIGRPYRLVGGDQNEPFNSMEDGGLHEQLGAENIIVDSLPRVAFNQRHMFVGGGVKHDRRAMLPEDTVKQTQILDLAKNGYGLDRVVFMAQLHLNVIEILFAAVEEDDQARRESQGLTAQFGSDRAAGTGNQHRFAR